MLLNNTNFMIFAITLLLFLNDLFCVLKTIWPNFIAMIHLNPIKSSALMYIVNSVLQWCYSYISSFLFFCARDLTILQNYEASDRLVFSVSVFLCPKFGNCDNSVQSI